MTFSIQNNPYLSMYQQPPPPAPPNDCAPPRKTPGFRQSLPSRLHGLPGLDLVNTILASYRAHKVKPDATATQPHMSYPPVNPLLASPGWFQQALVNSLLLPRPFVDDTCLPPVPPVRPPDLGSLMSPKLPTPMPPSPATSKSRTSSCDSVMRMDKDTPDPLLYCRSTFYPLLKDQVDRAHSSWRTSDTPKHVNSDPVPETGTLVPSLIDGEVIMGFNVWGEKRLCLPHLFRFVLNDVDLKAIDEACTKLQITCTTCTPAQLKLLHARRILPKAVSTCGLIRKSDAERLTKFIRNRTDPIERAQTSARSGPTVCRSHSGGELEVVIDPEHMKQSCPTPSYSVSTSLKDSQETTDSQSTPLDLVSDSGLTRKRDSSTESQSHSNEPIPVLHECFGRQSGLIHPELYTEPSAKCIECQTCHRLFAPDQFVGHTHTVTEVDNLNHWGFDSNNWRCYLRLYTGRQGRVTKVNTGLSQTVDGCSEDELDNNPPKDCTVNTETHRRLEEFKIKFAQPIRLPPSLSAALRTVGLCASVAPIPPTSLFPPHPMLDLPEAHTPGAPNLSCKNVPFSTPRPITTPKELNSPNAPTGPLPSPGPATPAPTPSPVHPVIPSSLSPVLLPQLTLRRLWAPNDGRIKVPPPPKPIATRDSNVLPKRLHTGPPILLHSHRVVSQAAADQYDRDFIPNVCLMPPIGSKYRKSSCGSHGRRRRLSLDCSCGRGGRYRHSRNLSSGSRSRSRSCSYGSSSSRTRSASASSTTSSCYSRGRWCKRYCDGGSNSPCSPRSSRSSSNASSVHVDDLGSPCFAKKSRCRYLTEKTASNESTVSDASSSRQTYHRRSRHIRRVRRRYRSATATHPTAPVRPARRRVRSASPQFADHSCLDVQQPQPNQHQHRHRHQCNQRQNRALAAAKAAQGAASRISPGLWSRHFANVKGNTGGTLELPNARQPAVLNPFVKNTRGPVQHNVNNAPNATPVLVTGPSTNSLPSAVLALESIWTDLVRHINEYTTAVESRAGVQEARQRLFEQFLSMQTCYATHIAALMNENQKLNEPQPTRTQFSAPACPTASTSTGNSTAQSGDKRVDPTVAPDTVRAQSSGSGRVSSPSGSSGVVSPDIIARKLRRLGSTDSSVPERIPEEEPSYSSSQRSSSSTTPIVPLSSDEPSNNKVCSGSQSCSVATESSTRIHSSSAAPYKVSSGLCDRRLSEKYGPERIHWKRRPWDVDLQTESNGTLDLSLPSSEPIQKRRAVAVSDSNSYE
ncbi:unnamed protein product [Echinostoma caproni]|uniref:C-SKI_SMAD_bind domain-containing protein n=1 Tax=Echinostoma caproni TaxID=27848 RepID=A0A183A5N0_9TREM|nr:unnamed protein product [Echinostoma caproni]